MLAVNSISLDRFTAVVIDEPIVPDPGIGEFVQRPFHRITENGAVDME